MPLKHYSSQTKLALRSKRGWDGYILRKYPKVLRISKIECCIYLSLLKQYVCMHPNDQVEIRLMVQLD